MTVMVGTWQQAGRHDNWEKAENLYVIHKLIQKERELIGNSRSDHNA